ncbi:MAG: anaerobic ribonucleoside-triphosphate reductase activating protein [Campylobacteraceae bacterium]|nr:anaerobic ribonucleoside-triphosphate reductase activating protein [Campylobacteraceae bacterium]
MQTKPISEITRFTTLDFPDRLSCIVWFSGCQMRCPYCYNPQMVLEDGKISLEELFKFLNSRKGKLDGVVLSGGESTLFPQIELLCKEIKDMGFEVKIDTNGLMPQRVKSLVKKGLVDFISLDFKAPKEKFNIITKTNGYEKLQETLAFLIENEFKFEVRTTVHPDLLNEDDINQIISTLHSFGYKGRYALQKYLHVIPTLGETKEPKNHFDIKKLNNIFDIEFRNF